MISHVILPEGNHPTGRYSMYGIDILHLKILHWFLFDFLIMRFYMFWFTLKFGV